MVLGGVSDDDGHQNECGPPAFQLAAPAQPRLRATNPGVVHLDLAMQRLAGSIDHSAAQFVEHQPVRMGVMPDFRATTLTRFLTQRVAPGSTIYTDGLKSFSGLDAAGFRHVARTQPLRRDLGRGVSSVVPLADRAIGTLQQWLIGTYHGVSRAQLPVYLDEFVFRHNRRRQPMAAFQTLLGLGTTHRPTPAGCIRGARDLQR